MTVDELVRRRWAQSLRDLADFVEAHPALPLEEYDGVRVDIWLPEGPTARDDLARVASAMADRGKVEKEADYNWFTLTRRFGPHRLEANVNRDEVCERVVTGTRTVQVHDPELVLAVPMIDKEEDVVEWRCPDSILNPGAAT